MAECSILPMLIVNGWNAPIVTRNTKIILLHSCPNGMTGERESNMLKIKRTKRTKVIKIMMKSRFSYYRTCPFCGYSGSGWGDSGECPSCGETS